MGSLRSLPARSEDHSGRRKTLYFLCGYILPPGDTKELHKGLKAGLKGVVGTAAVGGVSTISTKQTVRI